MIQELREAVRRERVGKVIEAMRAHEGSFDMLKWARRKTNVDLRAPLGEHLDCGTTFCVAGFAAACGYPAESLYEIDIPKRAREWLGLSDAQADEMFYRTDYRGLPTTLDEAVAMLSRYAETGEVKWPEMMIGVKFSPDATEEEQ
jgi:hypothetical protein